MWFLNKAEELICAQHTFKLLSVFTFTVDGAVSIESCLTATAPLSLTSCSWVEALLRGGLARELELETMLPDTELDLDTMST